MDERKIDKEFASLVSYDPRKRIRDFSYTMSALTLTAAFVSLIVGVWVTDGSTPRFIWTGAILFAAATVLLRIGVWMDYRKDRIL